jgi:hypothetical protein
MWSVPHSYPRPPNHKSVCMDCILLKHQIEKYGGSANLEEILFSLDQEESISQKVAITFIETGKQLNAEDLYHYGRTERSNRREWFF